MCFVSAFHRRTGHYTFLLCPIHAWVQKLLPTGVNLKEWIYLSEVLDVIMFALLTIMSLTFCKWSDLGLGREVTAVAGGLSGRWRGVGWPWWVDWSRGGWWGCGHTVEGGRGSEAIYAEQWWVKFSLSMFTWWHFLFHSFDLFLIIFTWRHTLSTSTVSWFMKLF